MGTVGFAGGLAVVLTGLGVGDALLGPVLALGVAGGLLTGAVVATTADGLAGLGADGD